MFHGWDNFYLLVGSAAAALIGLLFVVVTLTAGREASSASRGAHLYVSPVVFHFAVVFVISGLAFAPDVAASIVALLVGACALIGLIYIGIIGTELARGRTPEPQHWSDVWCYAVMPAAIYLGLTVAAVLTWRASPWAPYGIALMLMTLLLVGIRNAWDLVTFLAPRRDG